MEPANILFVIAFIGLPLAFAIWAIMSRRELMETRETRAEPRPAKRPRTRQQPPPQQHQQHPDPAQRTVQMPATDQEGLPQAPPPPHQPAQETVQLQPNQQFGYQPAPPSPPEPPSPPAPTEETMQLPAFETDLPQETVTQPAEPEPPTQSGTTEEFPIIGYPETPSEHELEPETYEPVPVSGAAPQRESAPVVVGLPERRPFYPPKYRGRSAGVVKRLTPGTRQKFVADRSPRQRRG